MKKLTLSSVALAALFLSACGGGGSAEKSITTQISERNYVEILRNIPTNNRCEDEDFRNFVIEEYGTNNLLTAEVDSSATCATYDKVRGRNCLISYYSKSDRGDNSCVLAYDSSFTTSASTKTMNSSVDTLTQSSVQKF
jgi:hypothetical protein